MLFLRALRAESSLGVPGTRPPAQPAKILHSLQKSRIHYCGLGTDNWGRPFAPGITPKLDILYLTAKKSHPRDATSVPFFFAQEFSMSDSRFEHVYDPIATPNPAYDDDSEPSPAPANSHADSFARRNLAQTLLDRARARQEAIADAFVDALLDGKLPFFRILLELEQAALACEAEAEDARRPGLADILLPLLQRERARAAAKADSGQTPEPIRPRPSLNAPNPSEPGESPNPPQPGITDIEAAEAHPCRSRTVAHHRRRAKSHARPEQHSHWKSSPETPHPFHPENARQLLPARHTARRSNGAPSAPLTILTLTAVAAPDAQSACHIPASIPSRRTRQARRRTVRCHPFKPGNRPASNPAGH